MSWLAHNAEKPHVLYRAYGREGVLLYVGATHDLRKRMNQHRSEPQSPWLPLTVRITSEPFPDAASCYAAERVAICAEVPVFNTWGTGQWEPGRTPIVYAEHVAPYAPRHAA